MYPKLGYYSPMKINEETIDLFYGTEFQYIAPFKTQLLKWIGNKQRFAHEIASYFPTDFKTYFEPFLGSGAILATLQPSSAIGSDAFGPLIEIWEMLAESPQTLIQWYTERYRKYYNSEKPIGYEAIKASYNASPNGADLLFLCRSCYGGVVRFRKSDGYMSTPCGVHNPISPDSFSHRVKIWSQRTSSTKFEKMDFSEALQRATSGDFVYCDPPYTHSQAILYQGQGFELARLMNEIALCKKRGVRVALSIDGTKKSGKVNCDLDIPTGLFEREVFVNCGRSMLRRFQRAGESLEDDVVHDRLLLTY